MIKRTFFAVIAALMMTTPALASAHNSNISLTNINIRSNFGGPSKTVVNGFDVSYPQCSAKLPTGQQFGVVGLNNGLANNLNPCFSKELSWAKTSSGTTGQPKAAIYVNTGNPGDITPTVGDWPTTGTSAFYGVCTGNNDAACSYQFGLARATQDAAWAQAAGIVLPGSKVWLDVETMNSWSNTLSNNAADLEGMTDYFSSKGAQVGIYSTSYQMNQIVGGYGTAYTTEGTLNSLSNWVAGATSLTAAKATCLSGAPFTGGGKITLSQYLPKGATIDSDFSCI